MKHDIFIRTYHADIKWLNYALKSLHKFATGFNEIIVCIPASQVEFVKHLTAERIVTCPIYEDDYLGQQITKLNAHNYSRAEVITFWDSDVIALEPITPKDFMQDDKPILYKTKYENVGEAICWKEVTEKSLKENIEWEYMRRMPLTYNRSTLASLATFFQLLHGRSVENYVKLQPYRKFSEFNTLGAFAELTEEDKYAIVDTETIEMPKQKVKQFWSWSCLTSEEREEIENYLK